jgi:hypothetical protein
LFLHVVDRLAERPLLQHVLGGAHEGGGVGLALARKS